MTLNDLQGRGERDPFSGGYPNVHLLFAVFTHHVRALVGDPKNFVRAGSCPLGWSGAELTSDTSLTCYHTDFGLSLGQTVT